MESRVVDGVNYRTRDHLMEKAAKRDGRRSKSSYHKEGRKEERRQESWSARYLIEQAG